MTGIEFIRYLKSIPEEEAAGIMVGIYAAEENLVAELARLKQVRETHMQVEIVYENNAPHSIRDSTGLLLFFPRIQRYLGQDQRYHDETLELIKLAEFIKQALGKESGEKIINQ